MSAASRPSSKARRAGGSTVKSSDAKTVEARKPRAATASSARASAGRKSAAKATPAGRLDVDPARAARPAKTAKPAPAAAEQPKQPKTKLVRDSFTMPKSEYLVIDLLKQRSARAGRPLKKSEVLRAGVKALAAMVDAEFAAAIANVQTLKTGRPKTKKTAEAPSQG